MSHTLQLSTGKSFRLGRCGLQIDGDLTHWEWKNLLASLQAVKHAYHCSLADVISYGRIHYGDTIVADDLTQLEFDLSDVTKSEAIGLLDFEFRDKHQLSSEHYFVLSKVDEPERTRWAKIAAKEKLTSLELKRSIEAGHVTRMAELQANSGQGSGINTIQGVAFRMQQWEKSMGGYDKILHLPVQERQNLLKLLTPTIELAAKLEQSLSE